MTNAEQHFKLFQIRILYEFRYLKSFYYTQLLNYFTTVKSITRLGQLPMDVSKV